MPKKKVLHEHWEYIKELLQVSENIYSVIGFVSLILTGLLSFLLKLIPIETFLERVDPWTKILLSFSPALTGIVAFICLYIGSFVVYRRALKRFPEGAHLTIVHKDVRFGSRSWGGEIMPLTPVFLMTLDLINDGGQSATITELKVTKLETGTTLLKPKSLNGKLHKHGDPNSISLPWIIDPGYRDANLKFDIDVQFCVQRAEELAERLKELQNYEIELCYTYEDMDRSPHLHSITIAETYEGFKKNILGRWRKNRHDLFAKAVEV